MGSLLIDAGAACPTPAKRCFRCAEIKPLSKFYRHPRMGDGHLGKCASCTRRDVQERRAVNRVHYLDYDRRRHQHNPTRVVHSRIPEHHRARVMLHNAVARGHIVKPTECSDCRRSLPPEKIQGHHEDYDQPLAVIWLCSVCHGVRHRIDPERRAA